MKTIKVCIIGAGPCGMNLLAELDGCNDENLQIELTCYEKQSSVGGMWNYSWRTGCNKNLIICSIK